MSLTLMINYWHKVSLPKFVFITIYISIFLLNTEQNKISNCLKHLKLFITYNIQIHIFDKTLIYKTKSLSFYVLYSQYQKEKVEGLIMWLLWDNVNQIRFNIFSSPLSLNTRWKICYLNKELSTRNTFYFLCVKMFNVSIYSSAINLLIKSNLIF